MGHQSSKMNREKIRSRPRALFTMTLYRTLQQDESVSMKSCLTRRYSAAVVVQKLRL